MDIFLLIVFFLFLFLGWLLVYLEEKKIWVISNLKVKFVVSSVLSIGIAVSGVYDIVEILDNIIHV